MGPAFTEPQSYQNLVGFRFIEKEVIASMKKMANFILLIATRAFGMGIDCSEIQTIIHWGIPATDEFFNIFFYFLLVIFSPKSCK